MTIVRFVLACLFALPFSEFIHAQTAPVDTVRPWGKRRWDSSIAPEHRPGPPLPAKFPEVRVTAGKGKIRAEFPQAQYNQAYPKINVFRADNDGKVALPNGEGTVRLAAMATAIHDGDGKLDRDPRWRHPMTGDLLDEGAVGKWLADIGKRKRFPDLPAMNGSHLKLLFRGDGVANVLWMNVDVLDAESLATLNHFGYSSGRKNPAVFDSIGPMWNDGPVYVVVEFAYGKFDEAVGPAKPGTVLKLRGGAMAGLFHLQSGMQRGANYGYDAPSFVEVPFVAPDPKLPSTLAICGFLPHDFGTITDFELIDKKGNIAVESGTPRDYVFERNFRGMLAGDAVKFRVRKRPHHARMIVKLPGLPGMPNHRAEVKDTLDQKIPYMKFPNIDRMVQFIGIGAQLFSAPNLRGHDGIDSLKFPRVYRGKTFRTMLKDIEAATGVKFRIDPKSLRFSVERKEAK